MELVGKTHLARSAKEAAAFLDKAFHGNAAWHGLVRLEKWPRLLPQIFYRVHDREFPEPAVFEIAFLPISPTQCIMHIIGLIDGAALSRASVLYLGYMRCGMFCVEFQAQIVANNIASPKMEARRDSGHFNYSRVDRERLVKEYRSDRDSGKVTSKSAWASNNRMCSKTLLAYEREFPEP